MLKKTLPWCFAALSTGSLAMAQDAYVKGCEKFKTDIVKLADKCPDESAEMAKISCKGQEEMNAATKVFRKCTDKVMGAALAKAKAGEESKGPKEKKCRAVDPADGKPFAEAAAPKVTECGKALEEKVKAARCAAGTAKVDYMKQMEAAGSWTRGVKTSLACK
jgi:hypothetical protein